MEQRSQDAGYRWTFAQAQFDESRWELSVDGKPVELERKPLELLAQLLRHAGEVLTKDELLESVWTGRIVVEAALTNAIGKLRKALGDETQALIVTVPRVGYRLDGPVSRKAAQALPPASMLAAGDPVPRRPNYRLLERLARNEDSEVWRAEQPKSHETRVFKFSLDGARLPGLKREVTLSRLLRDALGEREDFVRVLDWDFEQAPYFIESDYGGSSLDSWFGQQGDAIDRGQRLALLAEIADAVASAHEVGVLHKDLKPANILVYGEPGNWHPRLTDFGSGRVLDAGHLEALGITQLGLTRTQTMTSDSRSGTPLYLAPEVIAGQSPSIKSDLYALGVILYQFLAGDFRRPLSPGWESGIDDALLRQDIADFANGDPGKRPPSARVLSERLRTLDARRMHHDLERAVQARIADSERKLALVQARRPWLMATIALLMAGLTASLIYTQRAERMRIAEADARNKADASLLAQTQLSEFLSNDVIGGAEPNRNGGKQITVAQALDKAEASVSARFRSDQRSEGIIRLALANAFRSLSDTKKAIRQFELAMPLLNKTYGKTDMRSYDAAIGRGHMLADLGKLDEAEAQFIEVALSLANDATAPADMRLTHEHGVGYLAQQRGDAKASVASFRRQMRLFEEYPELDRGLMLKTQGQLGFALLSAGEDPEIAANLMQDALKKLEKRYGRQHSHTTLTRQQLVQALMQLGKMPEALVQIAMLEEDLLATLGPGKPDLANIHTLRGVALTAENRFAEAAEQYGKASRIFATTLGADSQFTLNTLQYQAETLRWAGQSAEAVKLLRGRLADAVRVFSDPSPALADYAMVLAMALLDVDNEDEAKALVSMVHIDDGTIDDEANSARKGLTLLLQGRLLIAADLTADGLNMLDAALSALPSDSDYSREIKSRLVEGKRSQRNSATRR